MESLRTKAGLSFGFYDLESELGVVVMKGVDLELFVQMIMNGFGVGSRWVRERVGDFWGMNVGINIILKYFYFDKLKIVVFDVWSVSVSDLERERDWDWKIFLNMNLDNCLCDQ